MELLQSLRSVSTVGKSFEVDVDTKRSLGELVRTVCKKSVNYLECFKDADNPGNIVPTKIILEPYTPTSKGFLPEIFDEVRGKKLFMPTLREVISLYRQHRQLFTADPQIDSSEGLVILCSGTVVELPVLSGTSYIVSLEIVKPRNASFVSEIEVLIGHMATDTKLQKNMRLYTSNTLAF